MKNTDCCHNKCWGLFLASFGIFFLVANLVPSHMAVLKYWPVFMIVGGLLKAYHGCFIKFFK